MLRKLLGLNGDSRTVDMIKFLLGNVGGKFAAFCTVLLGFLHLIAPEIGGHWGDFLVRAQVTVVSWLLASMFWRGVRNQQLLVTALAQKQISDPILPDESNDTAVNREIQKQLKDIAEGPKTP